MFRRGLHRLLIITLMLMGAGARYVGLSAFSVQAANVTLTLTASPAAGGRVKLPSGTWSTASNGTVSQSVVSGKALQIQAQAFSGYTFSKWNDGNTNATRAIQITSNKTYTAYFTPNKVTLTVTSNNTNYGTVTGGGTYNYNTSVTLTATPITGYHFVQWSDGNTNASRTVTATANATYAATFAINQYTIKFVNNGTTLQTLTVNHGVKPRYTGSTPTKTATAQYTYTFSGWSPTVVAATADATYTAQFSSTVRSYTIRFLNGSSVLQSSSVKYGTTPSYTGTTPTKSATVQYIYTFSGWSPTIYAVNKAQDYTAQFTSTVRSYKITGASANTAMGTVSGTATKQYGQTVTLTATPKDCYQFVQWNDGNTTNPRTVTVQGTATYTATFEENIYSGTCGATGNGANVQWSLNMCTGTLSITGTGAMKDYGSNSTPWDSYRASIKSITIANGVTHIGSSSFHYCAATSVTIPSSVITIGDFAFFRCASLTSINIPSSVTTINFEAFMGCSSLTSVTIPNSVTGLGMGVFEDCTSLTSATLSNSITTIPSGLFEGCSALTSVKIPNGVTLIDGYAFAECSSLPSVTIPNSVTMLGYRVLYKCTSLKDIYVSWTTPDAIPEFPPYDMPTGSAIRLHIPCGTKSIYQTPSGWKSYTHVEEIADGTCGAPGNEGNVKWSLSCDSTLTISGTGAMADWSSESAVPWYAYKDAIRSVVINEGVTRIGSYAFKYCNKIVNVSIPSSTTSIGIWAFDQCTGVEGLHISDLTAWCTVQFESFASNPLYYAAKPDLYVNDELIVNLVIPEGVTSIYKHAFQHCSAQTITLPEGLQIIGEGNASAFAYTTISSITIPQSVTYLGRWSFTDNDNLTDIYVYWTENIPAWNNMTNKSPQSNITLHVPCGTESLYQAATGWKNYNVAGSDIASGTCGADGDNLTWTLNACDSTLTISGTGAMANYPALNMPWKDYRTSITSVIISEGVTTIGAHAFSGCSHLTSLTVPSSLTSVGQNAFTSCWAMESVYISDLEAWCNIDFGTYDSSPFSRNGYSNYVGGGDLYVNGTKVTTLTIPDGITEIKNDAFYGFAGITDIEFNQVTSIGREAFNGCHGLTEITIPEGVTAIGQYGFSYCSHLQSISIPASVSSLGTSMLAADNMLTDIHVQWTENIPVWPDNFTKKNPQSSITLHIPCGAEELYSAANGWKEYTTESEGGPYTVTVQAADPTMGDVSIVVN